MESVNLGDVGDFFGGLTKDFIAGWQAVNPPTVPVPSAGTKPDASVTSKAAQPTGISATTTLLLFAALGALVVAFFLWVRSRRRGVV